MKSVELIALVLTEIHIREANRQFQELKNIKFIHADIMEHGFFISFPTSRWECLPYRSAVFVLNRGRSTKIRYKGRTLIPEKYIDTNHRLRI